MTVNLIMALKPEDRFCKKKRCIEKEKKESGSTKLTFIKKWMMKGRGGVWMETGTFECPNCNHRYRKHIRSGREVPDSKKRMGEALLGLGINIKDKYGSDAK